MEGEGLMQTQARVLEIIRAAGRTFLKLELLSGDVRANEILGSPSAEVQVLGIAFSPPDEWNRGVRLVNIRVVKGDAPTAGVILVGR